jgi:hypothetical protein
MTKLSHNTLYTIDGKDDLRTTVFNGLFHAIAFNGLFHTIAFNELEGPFLALTQAGDSWEGSFIESYSMPLI